MRTIKDFTKEFERLVGEYFGVTPYQILTSSDFVDGDFVINSSMYSGKLPILSMCLVPEDAGVLKTRWIDIPCLPQVEFEKSSGLTLEEALNYVTENLLVEKVMFIIENLES